MDEPRLHRSIGEALNLVHQFDGGKLHGVRLLNVKESVIPATHEITRYGRLLELSDGEESFRIVVAITKLENARKFTPYITAVRSCLEENDACAILLHHNRDLPTGRGGRGVGSKIVKELQDSGRLATFPLVDELESFHLLECYLTLRDKAANGNLQLGRDCLELEDYQALVVKELKFLEHLMLFRQIFRWPRGITVASDAASAGLRRNVATGSLSKGTKESQQSRDARLAELTPPPAGPTKLTGGPSSEDGSEDWADALLNDVVQELRNFNVDVQPLRVQIGARFARLMVRPLGNTSINKVRNRAEDLKTRLGGIEHAPLIDSQSDGVSIDVQLPKRFRRVVTLGEMRRDAPDAAGNAPVFPVGQDMSGTGYWADISDPNHSHYLVTGTTGSGKSEFLKSLMAGMAGMARPGKLEFVLIDPKRVTFNFHSRSMFLPAPVVCTAQDARPILEECAKETERRYAVFAERGVSDLSQLKPDDDETPPRVVVICDEFPDLMSDPELKKQLERFLVKTAAKARAAGIHLVLAAQRPEAKVVTPLLRSNLPGRVCLRVVSAADSKIVLDRSEAADLLGHGDLLWKDGVGLRRLQAPMVTTEELEDALQLN